MLTALPWTSLSDAFRFWTRWLDQVGMPRGPPLCLEKDPNVAEVGKATRRTDNMQAERSQSVVRGSGCWPLERRATPRTRRDENRWVVDGERVG